MTTRYGASRAELAAHVAALGEPRYRADQVFEGLWTHRRPLESVTSLPARTRDALARRLPLALEPVAVHRSDEDRTVKRLWRARADGAAIETVLMRYPTRATVCVSSQAGCAMACTFCATGQAGFERQLGTDEIVEQVVRAQHDSPQRVSNVVFMGMGEPLANFDAVWDSIARLHRDLGIGARQITVSTIGVVPGMRRLAAAPLPVTLAVSLHAPDDALRATLVPLTRTYPIDAVLAAARDHAAGRGRRVTFEYACIAGVNDAPDQATALARRLRRLGLRGGAHVNLIPLNPTAGFPGEAPGAGRVGRFAARLRAAGITTTVRRNRGRSIDAACGQLRTRHPSGDPGPPARSPSGTMAP